MFKNEPKINLFLESGGIWEGSFSNFINRRGGEKQQGKIAIKVEIDEEGIITHSNSFFRPDGSQNDCVGSLKVKVEGNELINLLDMDVDPNTKTKIENHKFEGYLADNHIYIHESYDDVFTNGKRDHRENTVHYYFVSKKKIIMLADVYVNEKLLVFANTVLSKKE